MKQFTQHVEGQFTGQEAEAKKNWTISLVSLWALLPTMHSRLHAPLEGKASDCFVVLRIETEEIADHALILFSERTVSLHTSTPGRRLDGFRQPTRCARTAPRPWAIA